jgi:signal transduction histidine kinase
MERMQWLLKTRARWDFRSPHLWIIIVSFAVLAYFYYGVLTAYHDVYVVLFFYPLIYAAVTYRIRGVVFSGLVFIGVLLPQTLLYAYDPYSLARSLLFALFAFLVNGMGATLLNYLEHQFEAYKEIMALNKELNEHIERLQSMQKQLVQSEKMNALGQLSAAIAHEINNPLAGVLVYSKLLTKKMGQDSFNKEEAIANLAKIESAVSHCARLVTGLLDFARQTEPVLRPVAVSSVIDHVISLVGHHAEMKHITIVRDETPSMPAVLADSGQIQQVLVNLVVNAIQATPDGGAVTISTSQSEDSSVEIVVQDNGHGIAPENLDRLFTPFFTTKESTKGVGLGLALSYGIIERHGGRIEVQSELGKGSTLSVYLPAYVASD